MALTLYNTFKNPDGSLDHLRLNKKQKDNEVNKEGIEMRRHIIRDDTTFIVDGKRYRFARDSLGMFSNKNKIR